MSRLQIVLVGLVRGLSFGAGLLAGLLIAAATSGSLQRAIDERNMLAAQRDAMATERDAAVEAKDRAAALYEASANARKDALNDLEEMRAERDRIKEECDRAEELGGRLLAASIRNEDATALARPTEKLSGTSRADTRAFRPVVEWTFAPQTAKNTPEFRITKTPWRLTWKSKDGCVIGIFDTEDRQESADFNQADSTTLYLPPGRYHLSVAAFAAGTLVVEESQ